MRCCSIVNHLHSFSALSVCVRACSLARGWTPGRSGMQCWCSLTWSSCSTCVLRCAQSEFIFTWGVRSAFSRRAAAALAFCAVPKVSCFVPKAFPVLSHVEQLQHFRFALCPKWVFFVPKAINPGALSRGIAAALAFCAVPKVSCFLYPRQSWCSLTWNSCSICVLRCAQSEFIFTWGVLSAFSRRAAAALAFCAVPKVSCFLYPRQPRCFLTWSSCSTCVLRCAQSEYIFTWGVLSAFSRRVAAALAFCAVPKVSCFCTKGNQSWCSLTWSSCSTCVLRCAQSELFFIPKAFLVLSHVAQLQC